MKRDITAASVAAGTSGRRRSNSLEDWKENLKRKSEKELEEWIINRQRQSAALTDLMDQYVLLAYRTTVDDSRN
ncbi:TPA: hypothetical protein N6M32_004617 [Escherichia coli]|nr:hypothetical protein [Escherichia coli]